MEWISVNDKLPGQHLPVLVVMQADNNDYQKFNNMQVAYLSASQWIAKGNPLQNVTHWLPLPPVPGKPKDERFEALKFAADSVVGQHIPADKEIRHFSFEIIAEGKPYKVYYEKDADGYWDFIRYQ